MPPWPPGSRSWSRSGDAGPTSTIGSPASDPNVISVGATYHVPLVRPGRLGRLLQPGRGQGRWANDNISSLSSGGFNQSGGTVDLVAPGDPNWALCSTDPSSYTGCADDLGGTDIGVQEFGGTSEAAPLTAAAAADVIQAYARAHGGTDPSPALVKQILCSTATDIGAPAAEQGAGLLNVAGAVKLAESLPPPPATDHDDHHDHTTTRPPRTTTTSRPPATTTTPRDPRPPRPRPPGGHDGTTGGRPARSAAGLAIPAAPAGPPGRPQPGQCGGAGRRRHGRADLPHQCRHRRNRPCDLSTRALNHKVYDTGAREFTLDPSQAHDQHRVRSRSGAA